MPSETWSARSSLTGTGNPAPNIRSAQKGVFSKEGEFWTIGFAGRTFRVKDTKGLGYLAHLLRHPTVEFHVLDLAGGIADRVRLLDGLSQALAWGEGYEPAHEDEGRRWLPRIGQKNPRGSWSMLALVIEGLTMLGERARAAEFYPLARELIDTGAVNLWPISRLTQTIAGIAAAAANDWEAAEDHFRIALQQAESFPRLLEQAEIRRFRAMMLIDRAAPGDREKAKTLLNEALQSYESIGMPRHVEMTVTLLARCQ